VAQTRALVFLQKTLLNIIFPATEYVTNLIIANVETPSYDGSNFLILTTSLQPVMSLGAMAP